METRTLTLSVDGHFKAGGPQLTAKFDQLAKQEGTVFHVWGHSYELVGTGNATLEGILTGLGGRPDVWYTTAGEIVWRWMRKNTTFGPAMKVPDGLSFTVSRPWLHPFLRTVPLAVRVPEGVRDVSWNGQRQPVKNGLVDLVW